MTPAMPAAGGSIVILTGAGISAESGLDTFRSPGGIWEQVDLEDVATPEAFHRNPLLVTDFYNARRRQLLSPEVTFNAAHSAIARLEREWRGEVTLVTQNIDDLHERAGSRRVIHMHGELLKARCTASSRVFVRKTDISVKETCECCGRPGTLRPHVVWFGEMPFDMDCIHAALGRCDLFLAIGTSGAVYPAAGFVGIARGAGRARTVELNLEPTDLSSVFDERIEGPAGRVVPAYVEKLLAL